MADHNDVGTGSNVSGGGISVIQPQGPTYYLGTWDASTNTPTLTSSVAPAGPSGSYYIVSVAGTTTLNGISDWSVGDWVIWSGSVWQKLEGGKTSVTVGSTLIAGGSAGNVLYDNAGTLGEYTTTGTAGSVVLSAAPTLTGQVRINGNLGLSAAPGTTVAVYNATTLTGGASVYGHYGFVTLASDVTSTFYGYSSNPSTQAAAFTTANVRHFQATNISLGAGSAVTNQYGVYVGPLTSATNNTGFYGGVTQAPGQYNLYMGGNAFNYMAGNLAIADTPATYYGFRVGSLLTGATSAIAVYAAPTFQSDITGSGTVFRSTPATQAAAFTLSALTHFVATSTSIGAGSSITSQYGFLAQNNLTGATNNYGFYSSLPSGGNTWNFYAGGTAPNYFTGATTFAAALTYGGVTLANSVIGTGSMVLADNPTLTGGGTITANNPALTITQTWNNAAVTFTGLQANFTDTASGGGSLLFDFQVGGATKVNATKAGSVVLAGGLTTGSTFSMIFSGRSQISSPVDGYIRLLNNAGTGFTGLQFGGTSASFPMIKVNGANIDFKVADDSAYNAITVNAINVYSSGNAAINWPSRSRISSATDGYVTFMNASASGFTGLQLGGTSASFPMIKVSSTELQARLADDSAAASFRAANLYVSGVSGRIGSSIFGGISIPSDGYITLLNNAGTGFTGLQFGGTTSSFPMLGYESANSINVKLADNSTYGNIHAGQFYVRGSGVFGTANGANVSFATDSYALFRNNAFTDFTGLRLGGTTSSFPMLRRNTTSLETKLADDSAYSNHSALSFTSTGSTWANIPAAGSAGRMQFVSNAGTKGSVWLDDGTRWKPLNGSVVLATLDTPSANIGNTVTIVHQYLIPAGMWQVNDTIRVSGYLGKSGTTDSGIVNVYVGTAGTTSDVQIIASTWLNVANQSSDFFVDIKLTGLTTAQQNSVASGYGSSSATVPAGIAISSAASNALYVSFAIRSSGATDTVKAQSAMIELFSTAN